MQEEECLPLSLSLHVIDTVYQLLAGAVSKTCTASLARLTILFQIQGMHSNAGKLELFGIGSTLVGVGPNLAISFSVYDTVRSYWFINRPRDSTVLVSLACGSLSGIASSTERQILGAGFQ